MTEKLKSPQEKKKLALKKDHFTFAEYPHAFRNSWKLKKVLIHREYRRKSDELLAQAKPGMAADDTELIAGDLTVTHLQKSVTRKRLRKHGVTTVGEKVQLKLTTRVQNAARRVQSHRKYDLLATDAIRTLTSLAGDQLVDFVRNLASFKTGGNPVEWARVMSSSEPINCALSFLHGLDRGNAKYHDALCRNKELSEELNSWIKKANRVLIKDQRIVQRKLEQKLATGKKVNALRRQSSQS